MVGTIPNIAYITSVVSCFAKNLSHLHSKAVKTIFCYFKASRNVRITYGGKQKRHLTIKRYFNSDWASNYVTKKSILGFIFMLNGRSVS